MAANGIGGPSSERAGKYVVGMPMWMWADPSPTTFGPLSASATAGGVTVTATAKVTTVRWAMGDGTTVTCHGPGTPYTPERRCRRTAATATNGPPPTSRRPLPGHRDRDVVDRLDRARAGRRGGVHRDPRHRLRAVP